MMHKDYMAMLRVKKIEKDRKQKAIQANGLKKREADRINLQKTLIEGDREEK